MKDEPLKLSVSKRVISGGKEVAGAELPFIRYQKMEGYPVKR